MKIEISNGELLDKISILEIKLKHISDEHKLHNVQTEYQVLVELGTRLLETEQVSTLYNKLRQVNEVLWNLEDGIRMKERDAQFDQEFIELARNIYKVNDERAKLKKEINLVTGSLFVEEKSYEQY